MEFPPNFRANPPASRGSLSGLTLAVHAHLPDDYLNFLGLADGGEGFIGDTYVALYSTQDLVDLNAAYQVDRFAPGLVLFGSNGGGEAFAFDLRSDLPRVVQLPFIPLSPALAEFRGQDFTSFLGALLRDSPDSPPQIDPSSYGREIHEVTPLAFGGDPVDPKNKALVPRGQHPQLVVYWNDLYQRLSAT